ncbi:hypothetical protein, partial [Streptomyces sp. NPDC060205]|uniref:hypothetical protein n=1 Tax=Streptomyces sp. NPDC060205 TaxID=3347072 RepID=UPI00365F1913
MALRRDRGNGSASRLCRAHTEDGCPVAQQAEAVPVPSGTASACWIDGGWPHGMRVTRELPTFAAGEVDVPFVIQG